MKSKEEILGEFAELGIKNINEVYHNLPTPALYEHAIKNGEGHISHMGPLVVVHPDKASTGRNPKAKFTVEEPSSKDHIWWGNINRPITDEAFEKVFSKMKAYMQGKNLYLQDCQVGADPDNHLKLRVITECAYQSLFARNAFIQLKDEAEIDSFKQDFTIVALPNLKMDPAADGTPTQAFVGINYAKKIVLIAGSSYVGEMKKSAFTIMNYLMPLKGIMSMHCSANVGEKDDVAVLFGLSGTGKTTLSADPLRRLIGDDEHGWSDKGVFNYEGGCYAKVINLSKEAEPDIYECTRKFGTLMENVVRDQETGRVDLFNANITENTRACYPLTHIDNIVPEGYAGHPKNVIMLTADAFGVLPPISKLSPAQAMYHFISGFTAKVAGTEAGVTEPQPTFSTCFGAPFMVHHPSVYAELLGKKIAEHGSQCWLLNTGWTGGPYGVGSRMKIKYTRAMLNAALAGQLDDVEFVADPFFGLSIPKSVPGVPAEVLDPKATWSDKAAYDAQAKKLAEMFRENFKKYEAGTADEIKNAGPKA